MTHRVLASALAATLLGGSAAQAVPAKAAPVRTAVHVDFGTRTTVAPRGYLTDYGLPFTAKRGYGWEKAANGKALSLVGKGVRRPSARGRDRRYDTLMQMQPAHSAAGQWQMVLRNGVYDVTVAVGDAGATNSVDRVVAQPHTAAQVVLVGGFRPTRTHRFFTVTKRVRIATGRLTLSPAGGRNTKIDFVVAKAVKDTTRPTARVTLTGTSLGPAVYTGSVIASVAVKDNAGGSGLKSVTYALDGAVARPYTEPVAVNTLGTHRLSVAAVDRAGNVGRASASWTQRAAALSVTDDFTTGGTVSPSCQVTGLDGVLANTAGNQCAASKIAFVPAGLSLTSTAGQLADDNQQNALYKSFAASGGTFTVTARVVGPVKQLTTDYQQIGAWFGPDQKNFVKVEAEHNGTGPPHLTMFYRENGVAGIVATTTLPGLTTARTVDLVIRSAGHQLTVYYSLDGAALTQVGAARSPSAVSAWFSGSAKAGIEVSNSGSGTAFSATFSRFSIVGP
ncbi:MAG: hypothetical protein QOJ83_2538 [Frankiales bacterium]|nr:hypothetical protein [Frankiales bacterium]